MNLVQGMLRKAGLLRKPVMILLNPVFQQPIAIQGCKGMMRKRRLSIEGCFDPCSGAIHGRFNLNSGLISWSFNSSNARTV